MSVRNAVCAGGITAFNETPLGMALDKGHTEVVQVLAGGGANLDATDWRKLTPLMKAIAKRNAATLGVFLGAGADPDVKVTSNELEGHTIQALPAGASALHLAACLGEPEIVSTLLAAGADAGARDGLGFTPLMLATASGHDQVARLLRGEGSFGDARRPVLHVAIEQGHEAVVLALIAAGARVDAQPHERGQVAAPLFDAAREGRRATVASLALARARDRRQRAR